MQPHKQQVYETNKQQQQKMLIIREMQIKIVSTLSEQLLTKTKMQQMPCQQGQRKGSLRAVGRNAN